MTISNSEKYRNMPNDYCVYILKIKDEPYYKIGKTNKWHYRKINIGQGLYQEYSIIHKIKSCCNEHAKLVERFLLHYLHKYKLPHKKEWFKIDDECMIIKEAIYQLDVYNINELIKKYVDR